MVCIVIERALLVGYSCVISEYTLHGKNIVHLTQSGHELHFY